MTMVAAREAGVSVEPRVERGFGSETLGTVENELFEPAKRATDNATRYQRCAVY